MKFPHMIAGLMFVLSLNTAMADSFEDGVMAFINGDGKKAYAIWKPLADNGNKEAQYRLGYMYQTGTGIQQDKKQALYWYDAAARNGHGKAYVLAKTIRREMAQE